MTLAIWFPELALVVSKMGTPDNSGHSLLEWVLSLSGTIPRICTSSASDTNYWL